MSASASVNKLMDLDTDLARKRWEFVSEPITAEIRMPRAEAPIEPNIPRSVPLRLDGRFDAQVLDARPAGQASASGDGADKLAVVDKGPGAVSPAVHFSLMTTPSTDAADLRRFIDQGPLGASVQVRLQVVAHHDAISAAAGAAGMGPTAAYASRALHDQGDPAMFGVPNPEAVRTVDVSLRFAPTTRQLTVWLAGRVLREMQSRGLHVGNSSVSSQVWNVALDKTVRKAAGTDERDVWCQECQSIGDALSRPMCEALFGGDEFYLGPILAERPAGRLGSANHVANLLIAPDGSRYVVDYWMGLVLGRPMVFDRLARWLDDASERVWDLRGYRSQLTVEYPEAMTRVAQAVRGLGQEAGRERVMKEKLGGPDRRKDVLLRSYEQSPW